MFLPLSAVFVVFCACVYMWSLLFASDCGDLCSKSPWRRVSAICVQLYTTGEEREASRILKLFIQAIRLWLLSSKRCWLSYSFPLGSSPRIWGFPKVLSNWITWRWREIKQAKHYTIFLGLYQVTRPLTSECAKLDKSMLKCIECTLNLVYTFEMTLLVSDSNIFKMTPA